MKTLKAQNLAKSYKKRKVVHDVSLTVSSGEVVGLLGPNGAGKTTTFYMIVGLVAQEHGRILINEQDISFEPIHGRARYGLGYLPQEASIFRKLSVQKNLLAVLELRKNLSKKERYQKLEALLAEFNVTHLSNALGMSLSGGERRRVEIARALATDPIFILLDEPFAGVDPISVNEIKNIITQLQQRGLGVLITDHNVRETLDICDRAYIVNQGRIIAEGTANQVMNNQTVKEVYLGHQFHL